MYVFVGKTPVTQGAFGGSHNFANASRVMRRMGHQLMWGPGAMFARNAAGISQAFHGRDRPEEAMGLLHDMWAGVGE
jgi:hypothetical protein